MCCVGVCGVCVGCVCGVGVCMGLCGAVEVVVWGGKYVCVFVQCVCGVRGVVCGDGGDEGVRGFISEESI